jgi:hypothetical protein
LNLLKIKLLYFILFYFCLFFMRMAWPHNPSHEFSLLTRNGSRILYHIIAFCFFIKFDSHYFNFFFLLWILFLNWFIFQFHPSTLYWLRIGICNFFMWWSRPHDLHHEYEMLTRIAISFFNLFYTYFFFFFYPFKMSLLKI